MSQINEILKQETIYFRKSQLLRKSKNQGNKLIRKTIFTDSLNDSNHPINIIIKKESDQFIPYINERNNKGKLIKPLFEQQQSNREIINKQMVKCCLQFGKHKNIINQGSQSHRSNGNRNKTTSTYDSFHSFFTIHRYNAPQTQLLKHKNSEPLLYKQ